MDSQTNEKANFFILESPCKTPQNKAEFFLDAFHSDEANVGEQFNNFIVRYITTDIQNETAYSIVEKLIEMDIKVPLVFERSIEDEIIIVYKHSKGINFIAIDLDGDLMISLSPYKGEGKRIFFDHGKYDSEAIAFNFLTIE